MSCEIDLPSHAPVFTGESAAEYSANKKDKMVFADGNCLRIPRGREQQVKAVDQKEQLRWRSTGKPFKENDTSEDEGYINRAVPNFLYFHFPG